MGCDRDAWPCTISAAINTRLFSLFIVNAMTQQGNTNDIFISDSWVVGLYDAQGAPLYDKEYRAPLSRKFFNVDSLRDGARLDLTSKNYAVMPDVLRCLFTTINGRLFVPRGLLASSRINVDKRVDPTFTVNLSPVQLKFWLIERILVEDKNEDKKNT